MKKQSSGVRGVEWRPAGWRFTTRVGGAKGPLERKSVSDPDHTTDRRKLRDDYHEWRTKVRKAGGAIEPESKGTFKDDVITKYLPAFKSDKKLYYDGRVHVMNLWIAEFGDKRADEIETTAIRAVRERWLTVGPKSVPNKWDKKKGPKPKDWPLKKLVPGPLGINTVVNRMGMLQGFFTDVHPKIHPNPVKAALIDRPEPVDKSQSYVAVEEILGAMDTHGRAERGKPRASQSLSQLRAEAIAYVGIPQETLRMIEPEDLLGLDLDPPRFLKRGRKKGGGTKTAMWPLTPEGAEALRKLRDAGGFEEKNRNFSNSSLRKAIKRAVRKRVETDGDSTSIVRPNKVTSYHLRHSFGTAVAGVTGTEGAARLLDHTDQKTAEIYSQKAIDPYRLQALQRAHAAGAFIGKKKKKGKQKKGTFTTVVGRPAPPPRLVKNPSGKPNRHA